MQTRTLEYFTLSKTINTNKSYEYLPPTFIFHHQLRLLHNAEKTLVPQLPVKDLVFTIPTDYFSIDVHGLSDRIFSKQPPIKFNISTATYLKPNNSSEQEPLQYSKGFFTKGHFNIENPIQFDDTINNSSTIRTDPNNFWQYYAEDYDRESELLIKSPLSTRVESEPNYVYDIKTFDEHFKYYGHLKSAGSIEMSNIKPLKIVAHVQSQKNFKVDLANFKNNIKFIHYFDSFRGRMIHDSTMRTFEVSFDREKVIPYRYDAIFRMYMSVSMFQHFKSEINLDSWNLYPSEKNGLYLDNNLDPLYKNIWPVSAPFTHDENGVMDPMRYGFLEQMEEGEEGEEEEESEWDENEIEEEEEEEETEESLSLGEEEEEEETEDERRVAIFHEEVEAMWVEYRNYQRLYETRRRRRREREEEERATGGAVGGQEEEEEEQLEEEEEEELNPFGQVSPQDGTVDVYSWGNKDYCPEYRVREREKIIKSLWIEQKLELLRINIHGNNDNEIWQQIPIEYEQQQNEQENEALWGDV